ncbi:acetyl-CoA carboxylase biotin carboxyl carrier protein subunit [Oenococcus sp. UCMA 16435]|nr:acetyl-CoA carboxylase biotin carboxyl carrier protein subunit [Oenococcus sp. UCMA 16435]MDN6967397.1 acetyl-CoA carboxylase biotin carboxyl carrier protein subunit [Oenococcus sp. UCMA 17063]
MEITRIEKLISLFNEAKLSHFEINDAEGRLVLEKKIADSLDPELKTINQSKLEKKKIDTSLELIRALFVGTFYASAGPKHQPFVKTGDKVAKGQTVAIIEAMKVQNEVKSPTNGIIQEIFVSDGNSVEYGEKLFSLQKPGEGL